MILSLSSEPGSPIFTRKKVFKQMINIFQHMHIFSVESKITENF